MLYIIYIRIYITSLYVVYFIYIYIYIRIYITSQYGKISLIVLQKNFGCTWSQLFHFNFRVIFSSSVFCYLLESHYILGHCRRRVYKDIHYTICNRKKNRSNEISKLWFNHAVEFFSVENTLF